MVLSFDIHDVPKSAIIDSAYRVQNRKGYFTTTDLYYEIFPTTRNTIRQARTRSASNYIAWVIVSAGAECVGLLSRGKRMYKFGGA